jgi:hypothetical protein
MSVGTEVVATVVVVVEVVVVVGGSERADSGELRPIAYAMVAAAATRMIVTMIRWLIRPPQYGRVGVTPGP